MRRLTACLNRNVFIHFQLIKGLWALDQTCCDSEQISVPKCDSVSLCDTWRSWQPLCSHENTWESWGVKATLCVRFVFFLRWWGGRGRRLQRDSQNWNKPGYTWRMACKPFYSFCASVYPFSCFYSWFAYIAQMGLRFIHLLPFKDSKEQEYSINSGEKIVSAVLRQWVRSRYWPCNLQPLTPVYIKGKLKASNELSCDIFKTKQKTVGLIRSPLKW